MSDGYCYCSPCTFAREVAILGLSEDTVAVVYSDARLHGRAIEEARQRQADRDNVEAT